MSKFFDILDCYDINYRVARSMYDIFINHKDFLKISNDDLYEDYKQWIEIENKDRFLKVTGIVKSIFIDNKQLPKNTSIDTPWGEEYIYLYSETNDVYCCAGILINEYATFDKLVEAWKKLNNNTIKIGIDEFICPVCGSFIKEINCGHCGSHIPLEFIVERGELMSKDEMKERYLR